MNILKAAIGSCTFAAVLIGGSILIFGNEKPESSLPEIQSEEISAAAYIEPYESSFVTLPIKELSEGKYPSYQEIKLTFLGDCILASNAGDARTDSFAATALKQPSSYFFDKAVPFYNDSDLVIANSEFVMSDNDLTKTQKDGEAFWFKASSNTAQILKKGGIDLVTIGNNHTSDYGEQGYEDTKAALDTYGIKWGDLDNPVYINKNGITFGIICTKMFSTNYDPLITPVVEEVVANSDYQIMYFHGGEENQHTPEDWLVDMCHKYADMGIDLIVGSHPHVLRPMEEYNGTDIIYSLGNFCYGGNRQPENRTVILNETLVFDEDGNFISQDEEFIPFYVHGGRINNWQPTPVNDEVEKSKTLAFMYGAAIQPDEK